MSLSSWSQKPPESNLSVHAVHRNARNGISEDVEGTGHPATVTITDAALSSARGTELAQEQTADTNAARAASHTWL